MPPLGCFLLGVPIYWVFLAKMAGCFEHRVPISAIDPRTIRSVLIVVGAVHGLFFLGLLIDYFVYDRPDIQTVIALPVLYGGVLASAGVHFIFLKQKPDSPARS